MNALFRLLLLCTCVTLLFAVQSNAEDDWTVMIYMGADNDVESYAITNMNKLEVYGSSADVNFVVQIDRHPGYDHSNGDWTGTRRYYVQRDYDPLNIGSTLLADLGELNTGDPEVLYDFVNWAMAAYPAKKYFLILWDHGDGWHKDGDAASLLEVTHTSPNISEKPMPFLKGSPNSSDMDSYLPTSPFSPSGFKAMCWDHSSGGDCLYNWEISSALGNLPNLDILGFDACLMGMIEVAYEMQDEALYMIASEETEPAPGWDYVNVVKQMTSVSSMSPAQVCSLVVNTYAAQSAGIPNNTQTLSAIELDAVQNVIAAFNDFCSAMISGDSWPEVYECASLTETMSDCPHYDLFDFADWLSISSPEPSIVVASNALKTAMSNALLVYFAEPGHPYAHGLTIFFPQYGAHPDVYEYTHSQITFPSSTLWVDFLFYYWGGGTPFYDVPEPNDVFTQAGLPLEPSVNYSSYISSFGDQDWFMLHSGIPESISVSISVPGSADYDAYLYDWTGLNLLDASEIRVGGADEYISYYSMETEYTYLQIVPHGSFTNQCYTLDLEMSGEKVGWFQVSYDDDDPIACYYSTGGGDALGKTFALPSYPMLLDRVYINFDHLDGAGTGGDGSFHLLIWDNYGFVIDPMEIGRLWPQSTGWGYLDLSALDISIATQFFVGVMYDGVNTPCIGFDEESNGTDYYFNSSTEDWSLLTESLFFRVDVRYPESAGYICGDANASGVVDIDDVIHLIGYIFVNGPEPRPMAAGDANCSSAVDIDDIIYIIGYIFVSGPFPCDLDGDGHPDC